MIPAAARRTAKKKTSRRPATAKKTALKKKAAGMTDEAVRKRTGKGWEQWFRILDRAGGRNMNHKQIVACLAKRSPEIGGWWMQMITVAYEQERGLRERHQKPGGYEISRSKTIGVSLSPLYNAWTDARLRRRWLPETITIRTATPRKSMRVTWADGKTSLSVNFYAQGSAKSQVVVQHIKLPDAKAAERMKTYWTKILEGLKKTLEP